MADPHALHDIDDQIARMDAEIAQLDDHLLDLERLADHIGAVPPPASPRDIKFIQHAFELIRNDIDGVLSMANSKSPEHSSPVSRSW